MRPGIAVAGTRHALAKRGQPYANPSQCSFVPAGIRGTTADFARRYEAQKYFLRGQSGNSYNMLGQELKSKQPRQSLVVFAGTDAEGVLNISDKESWNIKGLKTEVSRQIMRQFKKVTKGDERIKREENKIQELLSMDDPPEALLASVADVDQLKADLIEARERLIQLNDLEDGLKSIKSANNPDFEPFKHMAIMLGVGDEPPPKQARGPKKVKGTKSAPRQPFLTFVSKDGIEIRVGRGSADNDKLSLDPQLRDSRDWWMHVAGHPGSHVVIRCQEDDLPSAHPETMKDAAALAAKNSKGPQRGKSSVSYVRCRQVSKPNGAKAGLVHLNGDIGKIVVDVKAEADRLARLDKGIVPADQAQAAV